MSQGPSLEQRVCNNIITCSPGNERKWVFTEHRVPGALYPLSALHPRTSWEASHPMGEDMDALRKGMFSNTVIKKQWDEHWDPGPPHFHTHCFSTAAHAAKALEHLKYDAPCSILHTYDEKKNKIIKNRNRRKLLKISPPEKLLSLTHIWLGLHPLVLYLLGFWS